MNTRDLMAQSVNTLRNGPEQDNDMKTGPVCLNLTLFAFMIPVFTIGIIIGYVMV